MNNYNWLNSSALALMSQAHNNLNVLTHPMYYSVRSKLKNKQKVEDNMNLLCSGNIKKPEASPIDSSKVEARLDNTGVKAKDTSTKSSGYIKLYDNGSFSNARTYLLDADKPFSREEFLDALRDMTRNPIYYINSSQYRNSPSNNEYTCIDDELENNEEIRSFVKYLKFLDPHNLVRSCVSRGLVSFS